MILFKNVRYKNFLSSGNVFTDIQLDRAKTTLITGGTSGIGKSLAEHFAQNNSKIIILDIDTDGEKVAKSLNGDFYHADLSKQVETENIINQIKKDHKKIDILINNAGFQKVEKI